jgi:hypothetical protein
MSGYLFAHFTSEVENGEQVYFAVSEDGLHWVDLNGGKPALVSVLGECGVRDPFIVKHPVTGMYYLMGTDLKIESGKGWQWAQYEGSKDLVIWESRDLINWGEQRNVRVAVDGAGCAWAPESVYDHERQAFFVFWASMVKLDGDAEAKQRIYGTYTDDFKTFGTPFMYMESECHVIDLNIVYDGGWYYRFVKDETIKKIKVDRLRNLSDVAETMPAGVVDEMSGLEGPQAYKLPDGRWCLIADQYRKKAGYLPFVCDSLENGDFRVLQEYEYDMGKVKKRHGGVVRISEDEMRRLKGKEDKEAKA